MAPKAIHLKSGNQNIFVTVDKLFDAAFGSAPREFRHESLLGWRPLAPESAQAPFWTENKTSADMHRASAPSPGVKIYETEEMIVVEVELPSIAEESLYLKISGNLLIIHADRQPAGTPNRSKKHKQTARKVYRYVQLPVNARPGEVRARLEDHIVRIMIRKLDGLKHAK